ncbi:hypothetical protein E4T42_09065 [Aureobasidium subglaciale]|nr:hypothetical protein E4T42_09065 [Aureobasidium subglaciale]
MALANLRMAIRLASDWRNELREGDEVAEEALLMVLLPNIRWLDPGTSSPDYGCYIQDLWRQLLGSQSDIKVEQHGQEEDIKVDFLSQSGTPSSLSRLEYFSARVDELGNTSFYGFGLQEEEWSHNTQPPLGHLKHLSLDECSISESVLVLLVDSLEALESLHVTFSYCTYEISLSTWTIYALARRKETLKNLSLFLPNDSEPRDRNELFINAPFDLRLLASLETLSIDYDILFRERNSEPDHPDIVKLPHNLPESMEQLNIRNCRLDEDMAERASHLITSKRKFSKLKSLEIHFKTFEPADDLEKDELSHLSLVVGIFEALRMKLNIFSDDDKVIVSHPMFDPSNRRIRDEEEEWSDVSDSEEGSWEDESHEDEELSEDVNDDEQGRYNLRPR